MNPVMELRSVRFSYGVQPLLDDVSFALREGEILGVIGPNSVGKTTLVRLMSRVLSPLSGLIRLRGRSLSEIARLDTARTIAVVPQEATLAFPFTCLEFVLMGRHPHTRGRLFDGALDVSQAQAALAASGVLDLADKPVELLSGGERQRVLVARALAQRPQVLLLDEPTAHLDLHHQIALARLLRRLNREQGTTVVLVSHDLNLAAELSDRLLLLAEGRVVRVGEPKEVIEASLIEKIYRCRVWIEQSPVTGRPRVDVHWVDDGAVRPAPSSVGRVEAPEVREAGEGRGYSAESGTVPPL